MAESVLDRSSNVDKGGNENTQKEIWMPWLGWLSGLTASLQTKILTVRFPVRAHDWVAGQVAS